MLPSPKFWRQLRPLFCWLLLSTSLGLTIVYFSHWTSAASLSWVSCQFEHGGIVSELRSLTVLYSGPPLFSQTQIPSFLPNLPATFCPSEQSRGNELLSVCNISSLLLLLLMLFPCSIHYEVPLKEYSPS